MAFVTRSELFGCEGKLCNLIFFKGKPSASTFVDVMALKLFTAPVISSIPKILWFAPGRASGIGSISPVSNAVKGVLAIKPAKVA